MVFMLTATMRWSMLKSFGKRSGNKYTLLSIIIIILMMYFVRFATKGTESSYPSYVYYGENKYEFSQTVNESSFKFQRKYGVNYEGYVILLRRSEASAEVPEKVYIYTKFRKYNEYKLTR
jgi:hypothetical protein